jgi:hypothetical protein
MSENPSREVWYASVEQMKQLRNAEEQDEMQEAPPLLAGNGFYTP